MVIPLFSGRFFDWEISKDFLTDYHNGFLNFFFYPDKPFLAEVYLEYSFDGWKNTFSSKMEWSEDKYLYQLKISFAKEKEIFYRYKIIDYKGATPRFLDNGGRNFYSKLPFLKFSFEENWERKIALSLSRGKIVYFYGGRSAFTRWSIGHRGILVDSRNDRLEEIEISQDIFFAPRFLCFLDRIGEYFTPSLPSPYGEEMSYLDRKRHPYIFPFLKEEMVSVYYATLERMSDYPISKIITWFEEYTAHPLVLAFNSFAKDEYKKEFENEALFLFLNSYQIDELWLENIKVVKDEG